MLSLKRPHRGLTHYENSLPSVTAGILMSLALSAYLYWQDLTIFQAWSSLFAGLGALGGFDVSVVLSNKGQLLANVSAQVALQSMQVSALIAMSAGVGSWFASYVLAKDNVPGRYGLRAIALVTALPAFGYFVLGFEPEIELNGYLAELFNLGYWFMIGMPMVFALTCFTLPGNFVQKMSYLVLAELHLLIGVPLLALFHLQVLTYLGGAFVPALNTVFTVLILSIHLVAFYGLMASADE